MNFKDTQPVHAWELGMWLKLNQNFLEIELQNLTDFPLDSSFIGHDQVVALF